MAHLASSRHLTSTVALAGLLALVTPLAGCAGGSGKGSPAPVPEHVSSERVRYGDYAGAHSTNDVDVTLAPRHASSNMAKASVDKVWAVLPAVLADAGIPVGLSDPTTKTIGNRLLRVRHSLGKRRLSAIIDCGQSAVGASADSYDVILSVVTTLFAASDQTTELRTLVTGTASQPGNSGVSTRCTSTRVLESRIADRAGQLAGSGLPPK
jgi:hypothetical protein